MEGGREGGGMRMGGKTKVEKHLVEGWIRHGAGNGNGISLLHELSVFLFDERSIIVSMLVVHDSRQADTLTLPRSISVR